MVDLTKRAAVIEGLAAAREAWSLCIIASQQTSAFVRAVEARAKSSRTPFEAAKVQFIADRRAELAEQIKLLTPGT